MTKRFAFAGGAILAVSAAMGGHWPVAVSKAASPSEATQNGPGAPGAPRVAQGKDYDHCLAMLGSDPRGAYAFADAWEATGGGDGATHCRALAEITLGAPEKGAEMMEALANASHGQAAIRAGLYGQADQAWLMAGEPGRALGAATLALALSPDDPGLLIDRSIAAATLERYDDAVEDLTRAIDLDPRRVDALVFRGAAWRHLNQLGLAQDDIDRAFTLEPENADVLLERGILRQRQGDREAARRDWEHAIALAPPGNATSDLAQQNLALLEAGPSRH